MKMFSVSFYGRVSFFAALAVFVALSAPATVFAAAEGCNPQVIDAMQKAAQAKVAADKAATEQIIDKPDSVLTMTCFNQAAGVSAKLGGAIFTGDFTADIEPIIKDALDAFKTQFEDAAGADAASAAIIDYSATSLAPSYNCEFMDKVWQLAEDEGIQQGIPIVDLDDLIAGTLPPGAADDFTAAWNAAGGTQNIFSDLSTAMGNLPAISAVPAPPATTASTCEVLVTYGVIPGPCP